MPKLLWNLADACILWLKSNLNLEIMKALISIFTVLLFSAFTLAPDQSRLISGVVKDDAGIIPLQRQAALVVGVDGRRVGEKVDRAMFQALVNGQKQQRAVAWPVLVEQPVQPRALAQAEVIERV